MYYVEGIYFLSWEYITSIIMSGACVNYIKKQTTGTWTIQTNCMVWSNFSKQFPRIWTIYFLFEKKNCTWNFIFYAKIQLSIYYKVFIYEWVYFSSPWRFGVITLIWNQASPVQYRISQEEVISTPPPTQALCMAAITGLEHCPKK